LARYILLHKKDIPVSKKGQKENLTTPISQEVNAVPKRCASSPQKDRASQDTQRTISVILRKSRKEKLFPQGGDDGSLRPTKISRREGKLGYMEARFRAYLLRPKKKENHQLHKQLVELGRGRSGRDGRQGDAETPHLAKSHAKKISK